MSQIFGLLAAIVLAAALFGATLWSFAQIVQARGALRIAHGAAFLCTLAGMACLSLAEPDLAMLAGGALALAALVAAALERRWSRLLPLAQLAFAGALLARLPFGG